MTKNHGPERPTLDAAEQHWLDAYVKRLEADPEIQVKRVVVYGSKARGDAGPESDLDVLVLVDGDEAAVRGAEKAAYGDYTQHLDVNHSVTVRTERQWTEGVENELPFPRNVEAEGIEVHPEHKPARNPPGERPPVTRKGMAAAIPPWLKTASERLRAQRTCTGLATDKDDRELLGSMSARHGFDAVFFSAMAWCLTRGVPVIRRGSLPRNITRHLVEPEMLDRSWTDRIERLHEAWKYEVDWHPDRPKPEPADAKQGMETAREFNHLAVEAIKAAGIELTESEGTGPESGNNKYQ